MHRLLVSYPPPEDPTRFLNHYREIHVPLVQQLPELKSFRYWTPSSLSGEPSPIFLLFEADFADEQAMRQALQSPAGVRLGADVPNYSPGGATLLHFDIEEH